MKLKNYIYILFSAVLLISCKQVVSSDKSILSVSIEPQKYLLETIVGDKYTVNTVIPAGSNPESYDPSPAQMVNIGKSKLYFKIGNLGFENTWLQNIKTNSPEMTIVDCSEGIAHAHCDDHDHVHPGGDPHIWSSASTIKTIAKNMYNSIISIDDTNKDYYLENYKQLEASINETDSVVKSYLEKAPSKTFVIFHPTLSYFADEYGLNQLTIEVDGKQPTPQQLTELIKRAKKENVKVVFIQEEFDKKNAEVVAKEIGAQIVNINPLSLDWNGEMIKTAKAIAQTNE